MSFQRRLKRWRSRWSWGRRHLPYPLVHAFLRGQSQWLQWRGRLARPIHRSRFENVYFCGTIKSGSQWLCSLLSDFAVYRHSDLVFYDFLHRDFRGRETRRRMTERPYPKGFPARTIVGTLCIDYPSFLTIPKPASWRAFFVRRDARDLVVSWYFSTRNSHIVNGPDMIAARKRLQGLSKEEGLLYAIDWLADYGLFEALRSWERGDDPNVRLFRYEDLAGPKSKTHLRQLFAFLDIDMPDAAFDHLVDAYSFETLSGRKPGETDENSHIRKGVAGDWRNHFSAKVEERFEAVSRGQ